MIIPPWGSFCMSDPGGGPCIDQYGCIYTYGHVYTGIDDNMSYICYFHQKWICCIQNRLYMHIYDI